MSVKICDAPLHKGYEWGYMDAFYEVAPMHSEHWAYISKNPDVMRVYERGYESCLFSIYRSKEGDDNAEA